MDRAVLPEPASRFSTSSTAGAIDAMVDLDLNPWDMAATRILIREAGGDCVVVPGRTAGKSGIVFGAPALVRELAGWLGA